MKQYDKIIDLHHDISEAIDSVLGKFNHRRRNNNTTAMEDMQVVAMGPMFYAVMIVSYDDYQPDTNQAPPNRPRWIGHKIIDENPIQTPDVGNKRFIGSDHSDE